MLAFLQVPMGWMALLKRTLKEAWDDDVLNLAAQQAYYFFFALFPALLFAIALASFFPLQGLIDDTVAMMRTFAPAGVTSTLTDAMKAISDQNSGGILTFAFIFALWSSSGAMVSIITTLNTAYDVTESRPWWKTRLTAMALTAGIAVFAIISMFLILAGPTVAETIAAKMNLGAAFTWAWWILQWPLVFVIVTTAIGLVYFFAPDVEQDWVWITPGAILGTLLWLAASLALKIYYQYVPGADNAAYGAIGGIMVLMLWFYLSGIALLLGAEMNAEIEHASPYGKDPGERVPGEKRVVGARAQRLYEEKRAKGEVAIKPIPAGMNCDLDRAAMPAPQTVKASDLIIGAVALAPAAIIAARKARDEMKKSA